MNTNQDHDIDRRNGAIIRSKDFIGMLRIVCNNELFLFEPSFENIIPLYSATIYVRVHKFIYSHAILFCLRFGLEFWTSAMMVIIFTLSFEMKMIVSKRET